VNFDDEALGVSLYTGHATQPYFHSQSMDHYYPLGLRVGVRACAAGSGTTHRLLQLHTS